MERPRVTHKRENDESQRHRESERERMRAKGYRAADNLLLHFEDVDLALELALELVDLVDHRLGDWVREDGERVSE